MSGLDEPGAADAGPAASPQPGPGIVSGLGEPSAAMSGTAVPEGVLPEGVLPDGGAAGEAGSESGAVAEAGSGAEAVAKAEPEAKVVAEAGSEAEAVAKAEAEAVAGSGAEAEADVEVDGEAGSAAEPPPEPSVEELLAAERDQHLSDLQRVTAEFANFRKQTDKRNAETVRQAAARVMQAILPVLDACDAAALQQVEGVEPIATQLRSVLEAQGLEVIDQAEAFDPNRHEAAMSEPGDEDQDQPMVAEVLRTGYAFNGRVLRAAMVRVKG